MEFRILGPLEVEEDGRVLELGGAKQRALLAILLLHANEVVPRDRLIDELWGGRPPDTAATALQVHVSQLRKVLGPGVIETRVPGYTIRLSPSQLDLERFQRLVVDARECEPAAAAEVLREALDLWRGSPLAEFGDVEFARAPRLRLEELRLSAIEERVEADLALGRHDQVVSELERLVADHPLRERLRAQLMLALYRCERQADALATYRKGRRLLDEQLGLEPGEALQRLERAILNQDPALAPRSSTPAAAASEPAVPPTGTVTFLFTDIEASTQHVHALGNRYGDLLEQHHRLLRGILAAQGGHEIDTQGDAFFFAFARARDAVAAATAAQRGVAEHAWPDNADVRIRIGIHTGEPGVAETGYHGLDVVRAARISGLAHGGQILVSSATRDLVGAALPDVAFRELGEYHIRGVEQPERLAQVVAPGLVEEFPPLRAGEAGPALALGDRAEALAAAAEAALGAGGRRPRRFRRWHALAAAGAVLLAGAILSAVLELTSDSGARRLARPNEVGIIDADSGRIAADVPVGLRPVAVAIGAGSVWTANADDGTVSRIDLETRKVVATIGVGGEVADVAVGHGAVWVAGGNDGTVIRIDPAQAAVESTLEFGGADDLVPKPVFVIAAGPAGVWASRGDDVIRIDPATNAIVASVDVAGAAGIAVGADAAWATSSDGTVVRIDAATNRPTTLGSVPAGGLAPVFTGDALWMIVPVPTSSSKLLRRGEIWRLNAASGIPSGTTVAGEIPVDLALGGGALWVANHEDGTVSRIDPETLKVTDTVAVGYHPTSLAVENDRVWVAVEKEAFGG